MRKTPEYLQRGYPLPEPLEPERQVEICICVPCSVGHANAFLAQLYALTFGKAWEKDEDHSGLVAAAVWLPIVDDIHRQLQEKGVYSMGCNDTAPADRYRFDENGNLEVSHDNGLTWEDDSANDPRVNPIVIFPPVPGEDGDDKRCTVANSITTGFEQLYDDELNALETSTSLLLTLYGIIAAFIVFVIGVPLVGIPAFIAALLSLVVNFIGNQIPEEFEAAFTEDTWQEFLCAVYCNVDADGTITEGGFSAILEAVDANVTGGIPIEFFKRHMQLIGSGGMTNLGRAGYGGARDCDECSCGDENLCVNEDLILNGTLVEIDGDFITIESTTDYLSRPGQWISYGLGAPTTCCYLDSRENIISGPDTSAWLDCGGGVHFTDPQDESFSQFEFSGSGSFTCKFRIIGAP